MAASAALIQSASIGDWMASYIALSAWVQPLLFFNVTLLALCSPVLKRFSALIGYGIVLILATLSSAMNPLFLSWMSPDNGIQGNLLRASVLGLIAAGTMLFYFCIRARAFSPALTEARLQALTARIRPHFLFNSLNAVLSLIRTEPRQAETALEELADLFRVSIRDHRDLLPLSDEIAFCRQYLNLEKIRLGERLNVEWDVKDVPENLKIPPLMLQPLLENAVYHGIEPLDKPGTLQIRFFQKQGMLHIHLSNPCGDNTQERSGHHMALDNIRERLNLHFDLEARLETKEAINENGVHEYHVHITLPCHVNMSS